MGRTARAALIASAGLVLWTVAWATRGTCATCRAPLGGFEDFAFIVWLAAPFLLIAAWVEVDGRVSGRRVFALAVVLAGSVWEAALLRQGFTGTSVFVTNVLLVIAAALIAGRPHPDR